MERIMNTHGTNKEHIRKSVGVWFRYVFQFRLDCYSFPNTIYYFSKVGGVGDIGPLHRSLGTPMFGLSVDGQKYFEMHHTQKDVFELVNARELELGTASIASLIYLIDTYGL